MGKGVKSDAQPRTEVRGGKINARVLDEKNGYRKLDGVRAIRINSSDYRLLILEDFTATLGRVEGNVTFLLEDGEVQLENIRGYYKHQRNEFTLLIQEEKDGWSETL